MIDFVASPDATLVGLLQVERKQGLHPELVKEREHAQTAPLELAEGVLLLVAVGVGGAGVEEGGDAVEALAGTLE